MKNTYFSVKPGAKGSEFYGGGNSQGLSGQRTKYQVPSGKGLSDQVPSTNYRTTSVECSGNHPVITQLSPRNHPLLGSDGQVVTDRGEVLTERRGVVAMMRQKCMMWKYVAMLLAVFVLSVGNIGTAWGEAPITVGSSATAGASGTVTFEDWTSLDAEKNYWKDGIKYWQWSSGGISASADNFTTSINFGYNASLTAGKKWGSYTMSGLTTYANHALGISVKEPCIVEILLDNNKKDAPGLSQLNIVADNVAYGIGYNSSNYSTGTNIKARAAITCVESGKGRYKVCIPVFASDFSGENPYIIKLYQLNWTQPTCFVFESITVTPYNIYSTEVESSPTSPASASQSGTYYTSSSSLSNITIVSGDKWLKHTSSGGYYTLTFDPALNLSSYTNSKIDIWWAASGGNGTTKVYLNGSGTQTGSDLTLTSNTRGYGTIDIPDLTTSLSSIKIQSSGNAAPAWFRVGIRGTAVASKDYTVTAVTSTGTDTYGTVEASASSLDKDETTTITATPATGYQVTNWAVSGTGASISPSGASNSTTTTLTMGTANAMVTATFGPKSYTVALNNQSATTTGIESVTTTYNANTNLTSAITCPTKTSKVFAGYFTETNGGGVQLIDPAGNWIASAGGNSTYTDGSKNWKYDNNLTLYACWMEYAESLDLQNYVETEVGSSAGDKKTSKEFTHLTSNNYICSLLGNTELDNSDNAAYRGLKFKNNGDYILFLVPANYTLSVKWGFVKSSKPKYSINGGAAQTFSTITTNTDNSSNPGDIEISSQSYDQLVKIWTTDGNATVLKKITITAPAGCSAYEFHYGTNGQDNWETECFEQVGETNEWKIEDFTIPSTTHFYVGYHGNGTNGWNSTWSSERAWTDWPTKSDNKWQGQIFLAPNDGALGSFAVGQATGAVGTLTIHSDYNDLNKYLSFTPNGYGITYGGTGHAFVETATANMYETDVVTLPDVSTTYNIGLATATEGTYVKSIHSTATDEAISAMGVTEIDGGKKKIYLDAGVWKADASGEKMAIWDATDGHGYWGANDNSFMTYNSTSGLFEGYVNSDATKIVLVRLGEGSGTPNWDNKWNQTDDITLSTLNNKFSITGWHIDDDDKKNSSYTVTSMHPTTGQKGKFRMWANSASTNWYVHWIPYYVLSYNANDGSGTTTATERNSESSTLTVTVASNGFTAPAGYEFAGWATSDERADARKVDYAAGASYPLTSNATLYAVWTPKNYSITYKDGGNTEFSGTHETGYPTGHTYGSATALKKATKDNYAFAGWYTTSTCTGDAITSIGATAYTANITLYARWVELDLHEPGVYEAPTSEGGYGRVLKHATVNAKEHDYEVYYVKVDSLNGSEDKGCLYAGSKLTISDGYSMFKIGYSAGSEVKGDGWVAFKAYKYGGSSGAYCNNDEFRTTENGRMYGSNYARLSNTHYVRMYIQGYDEFAFIGNDNNTTGDNFVVKIDGVTATPSSPAVYTPSTDRHLTRYSISANKPHFIEVLGNSGANQNNFRGFSLRLPDVTRYTVSATNTDGYGSVDVTSISNVRSGSTIYTSSNTLTVGGTTITATANSTTAQYSYAFNNWTKSDGTSLPGTVTGAITVRANFTQTPVNYTLAWNANGGDALSGTYTSGSTGYGTAITAPNDPTRDGYTFTGWKTASNGSGDDYTGSMPAANTTYYAQWTKLYASGTYQFDGNLTVGTSPNKTVTTSEVSYDAFRIDNLFFSGSKIQFEGKDGTPQGDGDNYMGWKMKTNNSTIKFFVEYDSDVEVSIGGIGSSSSCKISYTDQSSVDHSNTSISAGNNPSYEVKAGTMVTITFTVDEGNKKSVTLKRIAISETAACTNPSASLSDGAYEVLGTALDLRTLWSSSNTTDGVTFTVTNAGGTSGTIAGDGYSFSASAAGSATIRAVQTSTGAYCDADETATITVTMPTYTVTLNKGGGTINPGNNVTSYTYGVGATLPTDVTKSGYLFQGWYDNSGFSGDAVTTISSSATGNKTFYAKWYELAEKCETTNSTFANAVWNDHYVNGIRYDIEGTEGDQFEMGDGHYFHLFIGDLGTIKEIKLTITAVEAISDSPGIDYDFLESNEFAYYDFGEHTEDVTAERSLSTGTLSLRPTSGENNDFVFKTNGTTLTISNICIYYEPSCTDPELGFTSPSLTKYTGESVSNTLTNTHNVEVSYSSSDEAVATVNSGGEVTIKGVGTTTITATAAAQTVSAVSYCADAASYTLTVNPYTITYNLNGGAWGGVSYKDTYTKFDEGYDLPTPTKTDYTFLGWYENNEFTGDRVYILPAGSTGNKTYYAKWGSAVTATWAITDNEGGDDAFYKGGSGHHVTAVLDQAEWDASGSAGDLDLSASEGVTLSSVTKGVYTSGDNNGKAYVEAYFSISGDIDEDAIWFFLNVPAAGDYAAAELSKELRLNDCPIEVGSPIVISIFDGTTDTENTSSKTNNKYKQSTQFTNATTGFKYELHGIKGNLIDISEATYTGRGEYTRAIQWGGASADYYAEFIVPTGYTASITITYVLTSNSPKYIGFGTTKAAQANGSNYNINETISSNNVVGTSTFSSLSSGTYYYVCSGGTSFYILGVSATLTPSGGVSGVPTALSWSDDLEDKAKVDKEDVDADFTYTATPNTNTIGAITYTSSDESVATVDGNGKVHIINEGPTTITATLAESGCYTGAEITYELNVKSTCADVRGTIVAADGSAIAGNSIEKGACETVTLKLTGYTDGATIQWKKDGENISGATSAEYTVPTDGAGVYTAVTTKTCDLTSNSVTVTSASSTIEPTIFADEFTVKDYRPFEYRLMQLNEGETCTVESTTSWIENHDFKITTEGNIVTIKGDKSIASDANETIRLKISNGCSYIYKDILIHATTKSAKPMIAWIATGDKGVKDNVLADQSTNTELYKALVAKDKYALTPRNCYWTTDEKELIKEYSQYDLVILTDYPNSRKGPNSEDDRSKSYTNALGLLIDRVPMLTFEAFVAGCPNWGLSSNPKNTSSTQNSLTLLCNANDIFGTSDAFNAGASVAVGTAAEGQALQGFELDAMPNFVFIAKITDGGTDYVTCCERQVNTNARMMVFGLNQNLMNAITDTGEDMVAGFVDYLLLDETASIPDCSVIFKGTGGTDWSSTGNWEGASLPNPYASVRIDAPCVVGDGETAKAGMIKIHTGSDAGHTYTGSLTIQPQGRMIVENGVYRVEGTNYATYLPTEPNNLVINADEDHTGALIFTNPRGNTQATVYLYSKATTSENTCWQYVGIPFGSLSPAVSWFYNAWMMKYTTGTTTGDDALYSWEYINNYDVLNGFQGYALTQTAAKSYQLQGGLAPTTDKVLAVSNAGAGGKGWNLYANSWTAPIHIDKMEASDFVNADATIYLYNTGSRAAWSGSTLDETGTSTTAGQYLAVPVGLAEYTGTKYIPSMQGFFVQGNHASAAGSVRLRYDAVVRDTTVMADLNTPLRTPSRETVNQEPEHVTMVVRGEKYTDVLHLFRSDEWSAGYENGYDAHKVEGDDYTPQLYAVTGKEELAVVATDEWEGTVLNFRAGSEDGEYTIFFRYNESEAEALYLYDLTTETYTRIENGGSYHFSTTDKETHPRFILTYNAPSVATGTGDVQRDDVQSTKARKELLDNHVYIFRNGKLYDSTGKMVK